MNADGPSDCRAFIKPEETGFLAVQPSTTRLGQRIGNILEENLVGGEMLKKHEM